MFFQALASRSASNSSSAGKPSRSWSPARAPPSAAVRTAAAAAEEEEEEEEEEGHITLKALATGEPLLPGTYLAVNEAIDRIGAAGATEPKTDANAAPITVDDLDVGVVAGAGEPAIGRGDGAVRAVLQVAGELVPFEFDVAGAAALTQFLHSVLAFLCRVVHTAIHTAIDNVSMPQIHTNPKRLSPTTHRVLDLRFNIC